MVASNHLCPERRQLTIAITAIQDRKRSFNHAVSLYAHKAAILTSQ